MIVQFLKMQPVSVDGVNIKKYSKDEVCEIPDALAKMLREAGIVREYTDGGTKMIKKTPKNKSLQTPNNKRVTLDVTDPNCDFESETGTKNQKTEKPKKKSKSRSRRKY